jgi:hypothetical protein
MLHLTVTLQDIPDGPWSLKDKAGFIQTPQDFWNVDAADPLVHSARFFYGKCCVNLSAYIWICIITISEATPGK